MRSYLIVMMAYRVYANGVAQKNLVSNGENLMDILSLSYAPDKIGNFFLMLKN